MARPHGFTCPKCGGRSFGTHTHFAKVMGDKYPDGARVGRCQTHQRIGAGCGYEWNRSDAAAESAAICYQTRAEQMAAFNTLAAQAT